MGLPEKSASDEAGAASAGAVAGPPARVSRRAPFTAEKPRRWKLRSPDVAQVAALAADLKVADATAIVLANRGVGDPDAATRFLRPAFSALPDPKLFGDMARALEVLVRAVKEKRRVVVHGDYDVDGVSGATILVDFLRTVGGEAEPFIPDRARHGYGLTRASLAECLALGARVIITCDCGTASVDEVAECEAQGVPVIITDHHEPGPVLPKATALLNPKREGEPFPDKNLCGTGVAFFLVIALRRALREIGWFATHREPNLKAYLDIVTIATIGDVVPLVGANRILAREGLPLLAEGRRLGIAALKEVAQTRDHFDEMTVSFSIVPRINAAGRLGSARAALDLLLCEDRVEARRLAAALDGENRRRQEIEAGILEDALARLAADPATERAPAIVLASDRWHMGVVGIIAARLVDRWHRPAVVLAIASDDAGRRFARGSARGIRKANLYEILRDCAGHLVGFGGHAMAAGMTLTEEAIPAFREAFQRETARRLSPEDFVSEISIDAIVEPEQVRDRLVAELSSLGPHGMSNPEPVLLMRAARIAGSRIVGNNHLRLDLRRSPGTIEAIGFGYGDAFLQLPESLDLAVVPRTREWNGRVRPELRIKDLGIGAVERLF